MSNANIRSYQQEAIDVIIKKIKRGSKQVVIEMPTGSGKSTIIKKLIELLNQKSRILVLTRTKVLEYHFKDLLKDYKNVEIGSYYNYSIAANFDYIILNDIENLSEDNYKDIYCSAKEAKLICFCNRSQRIIDSSNWLDDISMDYSITTEQIINEGYINPNQTDYRFEKFIEDLFSELGFSSIERDVALSNDQVMMRVDFVACNADKKIIVETKNYRSKYIENTIINYSVDRLYSYMKVWHGKSKNNVDAILVMACYVPDEIKKQTYLEKQILIIDVSNLLYLSQKNEKLMRELIGVIQYNIYDMVPKLPISMNFLKFGEPFNSTDENDMDVVKGLIHRLEDIKCGNTDNNDKKYEKICVDIIKFLFESEFTKMLEQSSTDDKMFKMDLICGLKGTSTFWKILIEHYNTRFIVFEFKNYKDEIDQNLIYITEKYLYNAVSRNVAIIISRKGFSHNARKAATGILTEDGKLIIEMNDDDLITMLRMKADGQDAADYLLNVLEEYLISISK